MFVTLMKKADSFFKKFSLTRLKLGSIIEFLDLLGMTESKQKLAEVLKTIKVLIQSLHEVKMRGKVLKKKEFSNCLLLLNEKINKNILPFNNFSSGSIGITDKKNCFSSCSNVN